MSERIHGRKRSRHRMAALALAAALAAVTTGCGSGSEGERPAAAPPSETAAQAEAKPSRLEEATLHSEALGSDMKAMIYLPPGYSAEERYPVLYVLYGYGGDRHTWFDGGLGVNAVADRLIEAGKIRPLIIVSPDYGQSFGANTEPGQGTDPGGVDEGAYGDYLSRDLVSYVDSHYGTDARREGRFVGGFSMGGYAALYLAFTHPDLYGKAGGHSAALWDYSDRDLYRDQRDWLYPNAELRKERDPFLLAADRDLHDVQVYLDVGASDAFATVDKELYDLLLARGVPTQWQSDPGGHDGDYWLPHLENYLLFYAGS